MQIVLLCLDLNFACLPQGVHGKLRHRSGRVFSFTRVRARVTRSKLHSSNTDAAIIFGKRNAEW